MEHIMDTVVDIYIAADRYSNVSFIYVNWPCLCPYLILFCLACHSLLNLHIENFLAVAHYLSSLMQKLFEWEQPYCSVWTTTYF